MKHNIYLTCGAMALALAACSEDNGAGTSTDPNTVYAEDNVLWKAESGAYRINTAALAVVLPKGTVADGRWFWETQTDEEDGGRSEIVWPVEPGNGEDPLAPIIDNCGGICGTAVLDHGDLYYDPFVTVGFTLAKDSLGNSVPVDVSSWGGFCLTYTSETNIALDLDLGDSVNRELQLGLPSYTFPKTDSVESKCVRWSDFNLPPWLDDVPRSWSGDVGKKAAKQLVAVRLRIQGKTGSYDFNISYIGTLADDATFEDVSSSSVPSSSGVESSSSLSSSSEGVDKSLWNPAKHKVRVNTAFYSDSVWADGVEASGYWYVNSDQGGESKVIWPVADYAGADWGAVMDTCGGICGTASLVKGAQEQDPMVTINVGIALDSALDVVPVDVSNWGGVCVEYRSETDMKLELDLGDSVNTALGGLAGVNMPASEEPVAACYPWSAFQFPGNQVPEGWNGAEIAAEQLVALRFKIQAAEGDYEFGFTGIGVVNP